MNKTRKNSFFCMIGANALREEKVAFKDKEVVILQIAERESYKNTDGYPVYISEVMYKEDYEKDEMGNETLNERLRELLNKYMDELEGKR